MSKILTILKGLFYIGYICYGLFGIYAFFVGFEDSMGSMVAIIATVLTFMGLAFLVPIGMFLYAYKVMDWGIFISLLFTFPGILIMLFGVIVVFGGELKDKIWKKFGK